MASAVRGFEFRLELKDGAEHIYRLAPRGEGEPVPVRRRAAGIQEPQAGPEAERPVRDLIDRLGLSPDLPDEELIDRALTAFGVAKEDVVHLDVEVAFADGTEIGVEYRLVDVRRETAPEEAPRRSTSG